MTLQEAIEIASDSAGDGIAMLDENWINALKLLIEAGKRIQHLRGYSMTQVDTRLPGETKE